MIPVANQVQQKNPTFTCDNGKFQVEDGKLYREETNIIHPEKSYFVEVTQFLTVASFPQVQKGIVRVGDVCPRCYQDFAKEGTDTRRRHVYFCTGKGWTTGYSEQGMEFFVICGARYDKEGASQ